EPDTIFGISCFNETTRTFLDNNREKFPGIKDALYRIPKEYTYELMRDSRCAIAKSGTVTLELALHKCPTVVVYKLSLMNHLYAKYFLRVDLPHYCIVNILAQQEVFPELIEHGLDAPNIFRQVKPLFEEGERRSACIESCNKIDVSLGTNDANTKASEAILRSIQC
ncbi:MAG TPA: lipid-A-disaccharide synthase, partial [Parachlamydiaceae bacterium]|nr:lipid-A-disaccharide synthase [Parachlamydiaceae bacterium]